VQILFITGVTGEDYVTQKLWLLASLKRCPRHPGGGCGFAGHGTYERASPRGCRIARWYCPQGHCTFSLLPDCLASHLSGTLEEVEAVVRVVEHAPSQELASERLRPELNLPEALRWLRRRVQRVHQFLWLVKGLFPALFAGCELSLSAFGERLGVEGPVLVVLREMAKPFLVDLPTPVGFCPRPGRRRAGRGANQQPVGPDPPGFQA